MVLLSLKKYIRCGKRVANLCNFYEVTKNITHYYDDFSLFVTVIILNIYHQVLETEKTRAMNGWKEKESLVSCLKQMMLGFMLMVNNFTYWLES